MPCMRTVQERISRVMKHKTPTTGPHLTRPTCPLLGCNRSWSKVPLAGNRMYEDIVSYHGPIVWDEGAVRRRSTADISLAVL